MTDLELVKRIFQDDGYVKLSGLEIIDATEERAVVGAEISDKHRNAHGSVQGGMLFEIADFAFAVLGNFKHPYTITQVGQISYIKAAYTDRITATAREVARSGRNTVCEVIIQDAAGEIVCVCTFNGFIKTTDKVELKAKYEKE